MRQKYLWLTHHLCPYTCQDGAKPVHVSHVGCNVSRHVWTLLIIQANQERGCDVSDDVIIHNTWGRRHFVKPVMSRIFMDDGGGRGLNSAIKINLILWTTHLKYINFVSMVSCQDEYKEFVNKLTFLN
jgi:hypothetical protein